MTPKEKRELKAYKIGFWISFVIMSTQFLILFIIVYKAYHP
jgi:hypothetical protein